MYTHWQASWRGAVGVGAVYVCWAVLFAGRIISDTPTRGLFALIASFMACICALIVAIAFRVGLRFCGRALVGLSVVIAMPLLYIVVMAAIAFARIKTHAQVVEFQNARDGLTYSVVVPGIVWLFTLFLLPALIAYGTARAIGRRPSVA